MGLGRAARGVRQPALVGVATTTTGRAASAAVRGQLSQNDTCREYDPVTRRRMTAIVLTVYDRDWRDGRIGAWIRAYRPDLLTATAPAASLATPPSARPAPPAPPA